MQQNIWRKIFDFLASLKLAVIVILGVAIVLALATIIESKYDTKTAQHLVYNSAFFMVILGLMGVNVMFAAIKRYPWKKHQIGFVMTHAGITVILAGAFISYLWGVDGSMALAEGDASNMIALDKQVIFVETSKMQNGNASNENNNNSVSDKMIFPAEFRWRSPEPGHEFVKNISGNMKLMVDKYIHRALAQDVTTNIGEKDNPAIKIAITSSKGYAEEWVFSDEHDKNTKELGLLKIRFYRAKTVESLKQFLFPDKADSSSNAGKLYLQFPLGEESLVVDGNIGKTVSLTGLPYTVTIKRYLPYAVVDGKELKSKSNDPVNPCVELLVSWIGKGGSKEEEKHIVFARFPEFQTLFGRSNISSGLKVRYEFASAPSKDDRELIFVLDAKGKIHYRIWGGKNDGQSGEVKTGDYVNTGWVDMSFAVKEFYQKALSKVEYVGAAKRKNMELPPAIHVVLDGAKEKLGFWLMQGESQDVQLNGQVVKVAYGNATVSLPFSVQLEKFTIGRDPGTNNPASFTSDVIVSQEGVFLHKEASIYMNNPLKWGGYTFYQSSYQENPGQPTLSILSVGLDPGRPAKYIGSMLVILGTAILFYFNTFLSKKQNNVLDNIAADKDANNQKITKETVKS